MADIKFACPHCSQHITCDELWGGHQLDCPSCKNALTVPGNAPPPAVSAAASLTPKPPASAEPRLAINAPHAGAPAAGAPQRTIPIRNLAPPKPKRRNPLVTYSIAAAVLILLAAGGYFGYGYVNKMQDNVNTASKEAARNADSGQVGHIAKLYGALDATDPNRVAADARPGTTRPRRTGVGQDIVVPPGTAEAGAPAAPVD